MKKNIESINGASVHLYAPGPMPGISFCPLGSTPHRKKNHQLIKEQLMYGTTAD